MHKVNIEFTYPVDKLLHSFAYFVHGHQRTHLITVYRVHRSGNNSYEWTLLGKGDPREIQMYNPIFTTNDDVSVKIEPGDWIAVRCAITNKEDKDIQEKTNEEGEMCLAYLASFIGNGSKIEPMYCNKYQNDSYSWQTQFGSLPQWVI